MLRTPSYIQKTRNGIYHFRIRVPKDLNNYFPHEVITQSLCTGSRQEALKRARVLSVQAVGQFDALRGDQMAEEKYNRMDLYAKKVVRHPDGRIEFEELKTDPTKPKEESEVFQNMVDALGGTQNKTQNATPPTQPTPPIKIYTIQDVIEKFCDQKKTEKSWTPKTEKLNRNLYDRFVYVFGNVDISTIGYETARRYKEVLQKLPPNMNKIAKYKDKSVDEVLAMNPEDTLEVATINKSIYRMGSLFDWAKRHGYVTENYFSKIPLKDNKKADKHRDILDKEDMKLIFNDPIFTKKIYKHPYYYWLPLLAMYTGARIEELSQLHLDDIRQEKNIWLIDINDKKEKKLKTSSCERLLPIHSKLISLGLIKYADRLRARGETRLFPELVKRLDGYSADASKWFGRFRKRIGVTSSKKTFHSFRHTVADNLKQKGIPYEQVAAILGHKDQTMTFGTYGKSFGVDVLQPVIEELKFGDVLRGVGKFR
jgi:integrase